ncbi:MAG: hypothetical protein WC798_03235 [Candidatus Paceibacterota bacterium]|jgi:UDPglucose 6-dehydrogenase
MRVSSIGFIGQGYVGKNYANYFESQGHQIIRYALEEPFLKNKSRIRDCDIVFIAVPTPTTPKGFDDRAVREALSLVREGSIVVIKSTIVPGSTRTLARSYRKSKILFSPEFLSEVTAAYDVAHPFVNIIGMAVDTPEYRKAARKVMKMFPAAPFSLLCDSVEAEIIKYSHNLNGYFQIILANMLYDVSQKFGAKWECIRKAIEADPYISNRYANPVHKKGRGAGGNCFIKDFAAFAKAYEKEVKDIVGVKLLAALAAKNASLLQKSGKDVAILRAVYGQKG